MTSLPEATALMGRLCDNLRLAGSGYLSLGVSCVMSCELDGPRNVESVSPTLGSYPSLGSNRFLCCSVPEVA